MLFFIKVVLLMGNGGAATLPARAQCGETITRHLRMAAQTPAPQIVWDKCADTPSAGPRAGCRSS